MTKKQTKQTPKLTATQRIEGLENALMSVMKNTEILAAEIDNTKQMIRALAKRLNATIQSGETGSINNEMVNRILTEERVEELRSKVDLAVEQGALVKCEDTKKEIDVNSFVVGRDLDKDRNVITPRIQFAVASLNPEVQKLVVGNKVGDIIKDEKSDGLLLEITEIYEIPKEVKKKLDESSEDSAEPTNE